MGLFIACEEGKLEDVRLFKSSVAGAEFNVAVGLTRLGHKAGYITRLGNDPFGKKIIKEMQANRIDTSLTVIADDRRTGYMLKGKTSQGDPDTYYYRKNSAASAIRVEDVENTDFEQWDALHTSGILPATSQSAKETTFWMMEQAREKEKPVFFDPNLRPALWQDEETMITEINRLAALADYVMPGEEEGYILCGSRNPKDIASFYLEKGAGCVVIKMGARGAAAFTKNGFVRVPAYEHGPIVDTVGAGDGFAAGFESAILEGCSLEEALRRANAIGAIQIMQESDNEGLPTREELEHFMQTTPAAGE